jgi:hypothetical protein
VLILALVDDKTLPVEAIVSVGANDAEVGAYLDTLTMPEQSKPKRKAVVIDIGEEDSDDEETRG